MKQQEETSSKTKLKEEQIQQIEKYPKCWHNLLRESALRGE